MIGALSLCATSGYATSPSSVVQHISSGSGTVIGPSGRVLTSNHLVQHCNSIMLVTPQGRVAATRIASAPEHDLALLHSRYRASPARLAPVDTRLSSRTALTILSPAGQGVRAHRSLPVSMHTTNTGEQWLTLSYLAAPGDSGSPVMNTHGELVGVVSGLTRTYQADRQGAASGTPVEQATIATPLAIVRSFLATHGIPTSAAAARRPQGAATDAPIHPELFVLQVECVREL